MGVKMKMSGLTWKSAWLEGNHASMVGRNTYDGLIFIFNGGQG